MTLTLLQKAQAWQKELDKAIAVIVYEDAHSFIQATETAGNYEILLHGATHAIVIGSGSLEGCHRVVAKILKYPQYKKNFLDKKNFLAVVKV
jgi:hypothetical protein